jgi:glutamate/tyrosine decarboxylase-like PLP-dependent enzyme
VEDVLPELVRSLRGMLIWGHPRSQVNVIAHPSIPSIIGTVLPAMYNPNLCSDESGFGFSEAEVRVASMVGELIGYDPAQSGGLFTFGGTGTLMYGLKIGLEKASPGSMQRGVEQPHVILSSASSHYANPNVAGWLGIGHGNVLLARTHEDASVDLADLERLAREAVAAGKRIAAIVATMGTTDAFGIDDLQGVYQLRERLVEELALPYRPHLHADAVIGWAWSVFRDYDFHQNSWGFRGRTVRSLAAITSRIQHLSLADSLGIDFHKTGFAPYISSLFLLRDRNDLRHLVRDRSTMPYLFHSGEYHPGMFSLETSRGAGGVMAALGSLLLLGRDGLRVLLGHAIEMAELLREMIGAQPELTTVNHLNCGPVTLFRAYPRGVDTFEIRHRELHDASYREKLATFNEFNRRIYRKVHSEALAGRGVAIGFTDKCDVSDAGDARVALKSYVLSPFIDASQMHAIITHVQAARAEVECEMGLQGESSRATG